MSKKIWDLDSYKDNFDRYTEEFARIKRKYDEDEARLREIRSGTAHGSQDASQNKLGSRMRPSPALGRQDSSMSFNLNDGGMSNSSQLNKSSNFGAAT